MKNAKNLIILIGSIFLSAYGFAQDTAVITTIGHASVMVEYNDKIIHVDPYSQQGNYSALPDADLILITHNHGDHWDINAINQIKKSNTVLVYTQTCANQNLYSDSAVIMTNGDSVAIHDIPIKAVPAYNKATSYHPKGTGNGYVLTLGNQRIYFAGDTEDIDEMEQLGEPDVAFIPMNRPYTMTAEMAANAAVKINPKVLNVYHYDNSFIDSFLDLLKDETDMEIRADDQVIKEAGEINEPPDNSGTTSVSEFDANNIIVYPNPATDLIYIRNYSGDNVILIYDICGNLVLESVYYKDRPINISNLAKGIYFIKTKNNSNTILISKVAKY